MFLKYSLDIVYQFSLKRIFASGGRGSEGNENVGLFVSGRTKYLYYVLLSKYQVNYSV